MKVINFKPRNRDKDCRALNTSFVDLFSSFLACCRHDHGKVMQPRESKAKLGTVTIFRLETKSSECLLTWLLIASRVFLRGPKKVSVNFYKPDRSNPDPIIAKPMYFSDWQEISRN
jgi:hypothetical protein